LVDLRELICIQISKLKSGERDIGVHHFWFVPLELSEFVQKQLPLVSYFVSRESTKAPFSRRAGEGLGMRVA
jgi:hypothetical protein